MLIAMNVFNQIDNTVSVVVERPTAALGVARSISPRNKYLYGLQVVVPGLAVCVCDFSMFVFELYVSRKLD